MNSVAERNLDKRYPYLEDKFIEQLDIILLHLNTEGDGTPQVSPEIEEPVSILYKVGDTKRECSSYDFMGTRGNSLKNEMLLLGEFPNNTGSIKNYHWLYSIEHDWDHPTTYIIAELKNGNFIYLVASMGGVLSEYYGTDEGDWQFGYLYVSKNREELIEKCMTDNEYALYIKTSYSRG